ncbi:MAG: glycoside hydrolase family 2 [Firmicutes bacterium]|nr:glycoside hydrolase family 2 [Bacillota bacterium]
MNHLLTRWGKAQDRAAPLPEYPRPQFQRADWLNLNGPWDYAIYRQGEPFGGYQGEIAVPFSPEARLSGVGRSLQPDETLYYRREFTPADGFLKHTTLLHFGAVDHACRVRLNGQEIGAHAGGYTPFSFDVSRCVREGVNEIRLEVTDPTDTSWAGRGKQSGKPGGIWYTAQSGIWQTVWLESLPARHLSRVRMEPDIDAGVIKITPSDDCYAIFQERKAALRARETMEIPVRDMRLWSPEDPYLYDIAFECGEDFVRSYFGMRKFSLGKDEAGTPRLMLNNAPYFHNGLLDQGYWPDGLLTAPSDEALLYDIRTCKALGFNMLRKHIKIEPLRWYYHCDREGMLVWQDMVNGGAKYDFGVIGVLPFLGVRLNDGPKNYRRFGRESEEGRAQYYEDLECMLEHLENCVGLAMWVPFNEGWGQFDANKAVEFIRARDISRTVDHASGWHDQGGGDCVSPHIYFTKLKAPKRGKDDNRALVLSEFGGYSHAVEGHVWNPGKVFGYRVYKSLGALREAYAKLYAKQVKPLTDAGLSAAVYTQVSDVEDEVNGLMTYDREVLKILKIEKTVDKA